MIMRAWFRSLVLAAVYAMTLAPVARAQAASEPMLPESAVPADVVQALRERVTQFFNYHIGPANRRAIDLVAEDTKDYYFQSAKVPFKDFRIDKTEYSKDLNKAIVWLHAGREWEIQGEHATADTAIITTWRIEDGKWVWYLDAQNLWTTPMGASDFNATQAAQARQTELLDINKDGTLNLPKDFAKPEQLAAQMQAILKQGGLDRNEVSLTFGVPSKERIAFNNAFTGDVTLELGSVPAIAGLKVTLEKNNLAARENGVILIDYNPPKDLPEQVFTQQHRMLVILQPFNQTFPVQFKFVPRQ